MQPIALQPTRLSQNSSAAAAVHVIGGVLNQAAISGFCEHKMQYSLIQESSGRCKGLAFVGTTGDRQLTDQTLREQNAPASQRVAVHIPSPQLRKAYTDVFMVVGSP